MRPSSKGHRGMQWAVHLPSLLQTQQCSHRRDSMMGSHTLFAPSRSISSLDTEQDQVNLNLCDLGHRAGRYLLKWVAWDLNPHFTD